MVAANAGHKASEAPAASPVELEVRRVRALLAGHRYGESLQAAAELALRVPENRDVLYLIAVSQRYLRQIPEALATLGRLQQFHPGYSRLFQERGHCFVALRDAPQAIDAFLRAVNINTALPASWSMLEQLYRMAGDTANAGVAASHVAVLKQLPPEVVNATALFSDGELQLAEDMVRAYLLKHGDHVEAMRLLARIGMARDVLDDAEILLDAVLVLAPDYRAARCDYARVLLERHKYQRAREQLDRLLQLEPDNRQYLTLYATVSVGLGEHEQALALYCRLLEEERGAADMHLSAAHSLKTLGRLRESIEQYRAAAAARPDYGDAYWSLANLKTYRFTDNELERMRSGEAAAATQLVDRYHLCFALGKAYEDRKDFQRSYDYYQRGNELKRGESHYRPEILENNTRNQIATCTRDFFSRRSGSGCPSREPIFILGLPRAGSTLLEQILASHSRVEGTQELAEIPRMVHEFQGRDRDLDNPRYPGMLTDLPPGRCRELGQSYLDETRVYRTGKAHFIDKMPNNFRHVGLIHLLLPNAPIIDARREPMACCFGNLKQLFASGQEFSYGISDIARYYRTYLQLMRHWDAVLPGRVLRIRHEDVVQDLEGSVRRMLDFCGLKFETACVEFHKTARSVRTASSEQVRQPIFRDGLTQWKNYEPWLGELRAALGDALVSWRD